MLLNGRTTEGLARMPWQPNSVVRRDWTVTEPGVTNPVRTNAGEVLTEIGMSGEN